MKKYLNIIAILLICIILTGCKGKLITTKCQGVSNQTALGYKLTSNYKINSRKNIVETIEIEQVFESDKKDVLDKYKKDLVNTYDKYNKKYDGYTYTITEEDNKFIINLTIDYTKLNIEKFTKDNDSLKKYLNDKNKLTLDGAKKMYEASNITCE